MKLILVRHGETEENIKGIVQGQSDGHLNEKGKEQSRKVAYRLKEEKIDSAYISDLKRAKDTAQEILRFHPSTEVHFVKELREVNAGVLTGVVKGAWNDDYKKYQGPFAQIKPEGGESFLELQDRAVKFYQKIINQDWGKTVLFVSHGGIISCLFLFLLKKELTREEYILVHPRNCAVSVIEVGYDQNHVVTTFNCVKHLD